MIIQTIALSVEATHVFVVLKKGVVVADNMKVRASAVLNVMDILVLVSPKSRKKPIHVQQNNY